MKNLIPPYIKSRIKSTLAQAGRKLGYLPHSVRVFQEPDRQIFFGYYDITPFSPDDRLLLACRAPGENKSPHDTGAVLELGFYDLTENKPVFQKFGTTATWNWQQGCRLQWLDNKTVIYNTLVGNAQGSVIQNVKSGETLKSLPQPVYSVNGQKALTLDFSKLHHYRRGYGYTAPPPEKINDDIILIDFNTGNTETVLTLDHARAMMPHSDMNSADHYFNHLCFSPGGKRFMVTHLWVTPGGKRRTRILIRDIESGEIICPDNSGRTSHYCWLDDDSALIFHSVNGHFGHYILHHLSSRAQETIAGSYFKEDGHPSLTAQLMITDTYPDLLGLQRLFIFDRTENKTRLLAKLYSPPEFRSELRCDLHPRLNHRRDLVCVDAIRDSRRAMVLLQCGEKGA